MSDATGRMGRFARIDGQLCYEVDGEVWEVVELRAIAEILAALGEPVEVAPELEWPTP